MDYLEFIARVVSHILDKGPVIVRYYGLYANAHRGKVKVDRIIDHLKLSFVADKPPPPRLAYQEVLMAAEPSTDYSS
jgi:hypothetical protein